MLAELRIENLLLIERVHVELSPGFNAFTGETGAGKSLLVDALNFLLGARGDASLVRNTADQAEVSARIVIQDPELVESLSHDLGIVFDEYSKKHPAELVISRTLPKNGRARAHANGRPIALPALKELGDRLLDIHGQHENQSLLRPNTRIEILDRFGDAEKEREVVRKSYAEALESAHALAGLQRAARDRQGREDLLRFQLRELEEAALDDLDPEEIDGEIRLLRGAEKIREAAVSAQISLDGDDIDSVSVLIARAQKAFGALGDAGPDVDRMRSELDDLESRARALASDSADLAEKARSDPERLASLEESRNRLRSLERKYGRDLENLKALRDKLRAELSDMEQLEVRTEQLESSLNNAVANLKNACEKLTKKRRVAARELEKKVSAELSDLGLKGARLQVELSPHASEHAEAEPQKSVDPTVLNDEHEKNAQKLIPGNLKPSGAEGAEILFSANPELPPKPLKECASGGEISRVMLALKGVLAKVSGADRLPVVVFDEVDAGVGGRLGGVLGKKLAQLAKVRQVLCVTHQPQLAAYAERQLKVDKTREGSSTRVSVECLADQRRVDELAQMLRGEAASSHTRAEAAAMLKEAQAARK